MRVHPQPPPYPPPYRSIFVQAQPEERGASILFRNWLQIEFLD